MNSKLYLGIFFSLAFHAMLLWSFSENNLLPQTHFSKNLGQSKIRAILKVVAVQKQQQEKNINAKKRLKKKKESKQLIQKSDSTQTKIDQGEETIIASYLSALRSQIVKNKYKNKAAELMKLTGTVEMSFKVSWPNIISDLKLTSKSRYGALNDSAIKTIQRIHRVPTLPKSLKSKALNVKLELIYK